jgi:hypothetical protein
MRIYPNKIGNKAMVAVYSKRYFKGLLKDKNKNAKLSKKRDKIKLVN